MKVGDDHELICRTYLKGRMQHIDKPLYFYRVHGENEWLKNKEEIQTVMWGNHDKYIYDMALKWSRERGLRCLDLYGPMGIPSSAETIYVNGPNCKTDLNQPWPYETGSVGVIHAQGTLQLLENPIHVMNEAWRVLAHGGFFLISVPSTEGVGADCDPTHKSRWNWRSFRYYTEAMMQRYIKHAGANCRFQRIKVENKMMYDGVLFVIAHIVAVKHGGERFYGELLI